MEDNFYEAARYEHGEMTPEERSIFEEKLKSSPELQEELELFRDLKYALKANTPEEVEAFNAFQENIRKHRGQPVPEDNPPPAPVRKTNRTLILLAFLAAVVLGIVFYVFILPKKVEPEQLFAANFMKLESQMSSVTEDWQKEIQSKNYEKALTLLSQLPAEAQTAESQDMLVICYIQLGRYNDAQTEIKKIPDSPRTDWLTAGLYLKQKKVQEAKVLLEKLAEGNSMFKGRAKRILEEI